LPGCVFTTVGRNHVFFPEKCIITTLSYLFFEHFQDNYDNKKIIPDLFFGGTKPYLFWNEMYSEMVKCIVTRLYFWYLFFESGLSHICVFATRNIFGTVWWIFLEIKRKKAWKNQKNVSSRLGAVRAGLTKYLFLKNSIFLGDFPLTKYLFFENSGKNRRFSFNKVLIFQKFGQN
jgi:hypothetical protein